MKKNIYLIGFMGVGKSTIGKLLAEKMDVELVEMDEQIEQEQGITIKEMFEKYGETYFRDLESALISNIAKQEGAVVSCGGGVVLREENVEKMKESGKIIFLTATAETIYHRVSGSTNRPILNGNMNVEFIESLMEKRRDCYESAADVIVETDHKDFESIVKEILKQM